MSKIQPGWKEIGSGLLGLVLAAVLGCSGTSDAPDRPRAVVLIVIDTLRADHLGCMGYAKARTPTLDGLAARGTRFTSATTPVPVTLPALSSLLTGRLPFRHGVRDNEHYVLADKELTLAERFQKGGWRTGAVVGSAILAADRGLTQGFEVYDDRFEGTYPVYKTGLKVFAERFASERRRADVVTDKALDLIGGFGNEPFFLMVHYFDVHSYYDPPPEYLKLHPGRPYDGEISYVDAEIGRLLHRLRNRNDALVLVVSDHGEGMGEHGEWEHGFFVYQSTVWIPFLVAGPGVPAGQVREDAVSLIDLEPTLAGWLDLPGAPGDRDGRRLSWDRVEPGPVPVYSETCRTLVSYRWSELRSLQEGDWKVIVGPTTELYNLREDPDEKTDLGDVEPAASLRKKLETITGGETRLDVLVDLKGDINPDRKELLESLGYIGGTDDSPVAEGLYPHPREALPAWIESQKRKRLYRMGVTLVTQKRLPEAVAVFDSVLMLEPDRADVLYNRAVCKQKLGNEAGFMADLDRALTADDSYVPALVLKADLDSRAGRLPAARTRWKRILELESGNVQALRGLADLHIRRQEWKPALPYLRLLVSEAPGDAAARCDLGFAALRSGRREEARMHLQKFLEMGSGDHREAEVRGILERELAGS